VSNKQVHLKERVGADPEQLPLSKRSNDTVSWHNQTDRGHSIVFTSWPFVEPFQVIQVPAKAQSPQFTVYKDALNGPYGYSIEPNINPPSGPPGDPNVLLGD
jgi:hypothetical protein